MRATLSALRMAGGEANLLDLYYCFRLLLGREAGHDEWQIWQQEIDKGINKEDLVKSFLFSAEFGQLHAQPLELVRTSYGFEIFVDPEDNFIGRCIISSQHYEPHVTAALQRELKEDSVFLDIGANMGWFTLLAANRLKSGKVLAVEANYQNVQILYKNLDHNNFTNVIVFPYAATDSELILKFHSFRSNGYVISSANVNHVNAVSYVQGICLDLLLKEESRIDVVKIDIEGNEPAAIRGMKDLLSKHRPVILSEFHPQAMENNFGFDSKEYLDSMIALGYQLAVISPTGEEVSFAGAQEILDHWHSYNQTQGYKGELQLDLILRPI